VTDDGPLGATITESVFVVVFAAVDVVEFVPVVVVDVVVFVVFVVVVAGVGIKSRDVSNKLLVFVQLAKLVRLDDIATTHTNLLAETNTSVPTICRHHHRRSSQHRRRRGRRFARRRAHSCKMVVWFIFF
jgi:hypothetical protein